MKNNKGFTLTEILLAVMIVGVIGVALAAVTTAALRESSTGRTRMILRNQVSLALRQLRQDIQLASSITFEENTHLTLTFTTDKMPGPSIPGTLPGTVEYTFTPGLTPAPGGEGRIGGKILRTADGVQKVWLDNVKQINGNGFVSPSFSPVQGDTDSRVRIQFIVQSNALPVVNEAIDETFVASHGISVCDPCRTDNCGGTANCPSF